MKKLSFHHSIMIYFIFIAVSAASVLPSALTNKSGTAGVLIPLCALPAGAVFCFVINYIYKNFSSAREFLEVNFGEKNCQNSFAFYNCSTRPMFRYAFKKFRLANRANAQLCRQGNKHNCADGSCVFRRSKRV